MIFIIDIFVLEINHLPKQKINPKVKALIVESGLMHFTKWENAIQIQRAVLIPNKRKAMSSRFEKDLVWLYINNPEEFQSRRDIVLSKGNRKEYDAVVF